MQNGTIQRNGSAVLGRIGGVAGSVIGVVLAKYLGMALFIPLAAAAFCGWVLSKVVRLEKRPVVPAFAVQAGHLGWMLLGACVLIAQGTPPLQMLGNLWLDVLLMAGGLAWLLTAPGLAPVIFLTLFQAFACLMNLVMLLQAGPSAPVFPALIAHILLRIAGMGLMWLALGEIMKLKAASTAGAAGPAGTWGSGPAETAEPASSGSWTAAGTPLSWRP